MALLSTPNDRILARRAARTRRSRWISKILFAFFGLSLVIGVRLHPEIVVNAVLWSQAKQQETADDGHPKVRRMPRDKVTVNRGGGTPTLNTLSAADHLDTQSQADALRKAFEQLNPGG